MRSVTDATATETLAPPDLSDPALYYNRELSWLQFNERVLELAEDTAIPLLERVKFCAIYSSNLDEFFMVRVAGLHDQIDAGIEKPLQDGRTPSETIDEIRAARARARRAASRSCLNHGLRPALAEHGIRIVALRRGRPQGPQEPRRALPAPDLPGPDAARRRPRAAVPVHLQPVAVAGRDRARSRHRHADLRAREGAEGDAAALRAGRRRAHVRPARGRDRGQPRHAVPGHGDPRPPCLPRHPRRRLHRLRRGRRPPAGRRGGAARAALRRGRAGRGRRRHERGDARADHARARGRRRGRLRGRRAAGPQRPLGHRQDPRALATCATRRGRRSRSRRCSPTRTSSPTCWARCASATSSCTTRTTPS